VLPALLIATAGSALGGMAALPGPAAADSTPEPAQVLAAALPAPLSPAAQAEAAQLAASVAQERREERASRTRTPVLPVPPAPVVPAPVVPAPVAPPVVAPPPPPPPPQFVRPGTGRLTSGYGSRWGRLHAGIDLAAGVGAPISAVAAGTVASAGPEGGYGNAVRVQHEQGTVTVYAHLSEVLVSAGQRVTAGTYLGREGSTGNSTGPHLHFEVRIGGVPVDPAPWLRERGVDPAAQ
jgi:murein DD-endopeptidase MepM/ murein hydrolase activator NlpD